MILLSAITHLLYILVRAANSQPITIVSIIFDILVLFVCIAYFIKWSINVCRDTSSVKMVWAEVAPTPPYAPVVWVVDGFSLDSRNLAWEPPASQIMNLGSGNRSVIRSYTAPLVTSEPSFFSSSSSSSSSLSLSLSLALTLASSFGCSNRAAKFS